MPDESRIPEIGSFGLTRRGRLKDLSFTLRGRWVFSCSQKAMVDPSTSGDAESQEHIITKMQYFTNFKLMYLLMLVMKDL